MAIIQYSAIVNKIIGKVGGSVFQQMGQSLGIRQHRSFRPSNAYKASNSRTNMVALGALWRSLTLAQQQDWGTKALTYIFYNRYGTSFHPTGYQLFCYIQRPAQLISIGLINTPYNYASLTPRGIGTAGFNTYVLQFYINLSNNNGVNTYMILYISPLQNGVVALKHQKFVFFASFTGNVAQSPNYYSSIIAFFRQQPPIGMCFYLTAKWFSLTVNQWVKEQTIRVSINP